MKKGYIYISLFVYTNVYIVTFCLPAGDAVKYAYTKALINENQKYSRWAGKR